MRILRYAFQNIIRNTFLSFSTILTIGLIVFFIHALFFLEFVADTLIDSVNERITISVNLKAGYDDTNAEVIELMAAMRAIPGVEVDYVSKEKAFGILSERYPDLTNIIESRDENPLPSSLVVKNVSLERYDLLDKAIGRYRGIIIYDSDQSRQSLVDYRAQYAKIRDFIGVIAGVKYGIYAIIGCFMFGIFVIIYTIIGNFVFFYRDEIKITQLVGGDAYFLYGPFIAQGALYTLFSGILSAVAFYALLRVVQFSFFVDFAQFSDHFLGAYAPIMFGLSGIVMALGALSGFISSRQFVREAGKAV